MDPPDAVGATRAGLQRGRRVSAYQAVLNLQHTDAQEPVSAAAGVAAGVAAGAGASAAAAADGLSVYGGAAWEGQESCKTQCANPLLDAHLMQHAVVPVEFEVSNCCDILNLLH